MTRSCSLAIACFLSLLAQGRDNLAMPRKGLPAQINVEVHDDSGLSVPGAIVTAHFVLHGEKGMTTVRKHTDGKGNAELSGNAIREVVLGVECEGYYKSSKEHLFLRGDTNYLARCIHAGRWMPWGEKVTITLRRKKVPLANLKPDDFWKTKLRLGQRYAFDAAKCDFVMDGCKGEKASFYIVASECVNTTSSDVVRANIRLTFEFEEFGGIREAEYDKSGSEFRLPYEFPEDGYSKSYSVWEYRNYSTGKRESKWPRFTDDYLQFRFMDASGKLRHGIIFMFSCDISNGEWWLNLRYYLNDANDMLNSEFPLFF